VKYWRMAFREGNQGRDRFPDCKIMGIAALDYWDKTGHRTVDDLRKIKDKSRYDQIWRAKDPANSSARTSLRHLWMDMKIGDVIYAKTGTRVVGRGRVSSKYSFDPEILRDTPGGARWAHFVRVKWEKNYQGFFFKFDAPQHTILELKNKSLLSLLKAERNAKNKQEIGYKRSRSRPDGFSEVDWNAIEGEKKKRFVIHRAREQRLRSAKIQYALGSGHGRLECEVPGCAFEFSRIYGTLGNEFAFVHHLIPLGKLKRARRTRLNELAIVCGNCHAMIHKGGECRPLKNLINIGKKRKRDAISTP
jgi:hypothetical protein